MGGSALAEPASPRIGDRWRAFWRAPDARMLEAGARGELTVARIRLAVILMLGLVPLGASLRFGAAQDLAGLAIVVVALASALVVLRLAAARPQWPRLGLTTCILDVTMVSALLALYMVMDRPWLAVNSRVTFLVYFLAIAASEIDPSDRDALSAVQDSALRERIKKIFDGLGAAPDRRQVHRGIDGGGTLVPGRRCRQATRAAAHLGRH